MNIIILRGHLGQDPQIKFFDTGKSVATCSLAVTNVYTKTTTWFNLEVWGKTGEVLANYAKKGSHILVQGSVKIEDYTTKDGVKKQTIKVVVNELNLLDKKGENAVASGAAKLVEHARSVSATAPVQVEVVEDDIMNIPF